MTEQALSFALGITALLVVAAVSWAVFLLRKTRHQKKQICWLMHDKGELATRASILEDALKEKEH